MNFEIKEYYIQGSQMNYLVKSKVEYSYKGLVGV